MARGFSACPAFTAEAVRVVADDCRRSLDDCRHASSAPTDDCRHASSATADDCRHASSATADDCRHASSATADDYRHASSAARNAPSTSTPRPFSRNAPPSAARHARTAPCVASTP